MLAERAIGGVVSACWLLRNEGQLRTTRGRPSVEGPVVRSCFGWFSFPDGLVRSASTLYLCQECVSRAVNLKFLRREHDQLSHYNCHITSDSQVFYRWRSCRMVGPKKPVPAGTSALTGSTLRSRRGRSRRAGEAHHRDQRFAYRPLAA